MQIKKNQKIILCLTVLAGVILFTIGARSYHDSSAISDETYKGLKLFSDVIELVEKNYVDPVDPEDLVHKAIQGMVHGLDPHSSFLQPEALDDLKIGTKGEFGGIGIVITMPKGILTVISPIEGTPAYKAGIQAGDIIIKVDGEPVKDMMLWETVKKMRGPKGTAVVITIIREGLSEPLEFNLIRDIIPILSVKSMALKPGYAYVRVTNFQDNTTRDLKAALKELESNNIPLKGLILDLRNNPGGLLDQAVDVSDLFLEKGLIVSIKGRLKKHTRVFKAHPNQTKRNYPMVVLINGGSASASEIVAGALQDHKRALILGTTSFGKGSVQTIENLRDGYGIKYTIARYYTPNGRSIQAQGIEPDIVVKSGYSDLDDLDEAKNKDEDYLKEKDLKNHLEAEPELSKEKKSEDKKDVIEKQKKLNPKYKQGILSLKELLSDNQIKRGLEIILGYEILKKTHG